VVRAKDPYPKPSRQNSVLIAGGAFREVKQPVDKHMAADTQDLLFRGEQFG
jgi:hypothetical protein